MRLDYFLKVSRLVKRRSLAKEMCDKHLAQVNEHAAKAGKEVQDGDRIELKFQRRRLKVLVEHIPERAVSKKDASELYSVLEDVQEPKDDVSC